MRMPIVWPGNAISRKFRSAFYPKSLVWNSIHGCEKGEAEMDEEGKQTMRMLAKNMTFLMKSIELGKKEYGLPEQEERTATNFIR